MSDFSKALLEFVAELARCGPDELEPDAALFESGLIDSLNLVELVAFVEERCGIHVAPGDLTLDNWNTLRSIEAFIARDPG